MINYQLIRSSRRKTLQIQIKQGQVIIRAPVYVSIAQIEQFIQLKSCWLNKKIAEQNHLITHDTFLFTQESKLYYLGIIKRLIIHFSVVKNTHVSDELIVVTLPYQQQKRLLTIELTSQAVKRQLACFYKEQLLFYLSNRLPQLSKQLALYPTKYKVKFYKSRWGSCNNRGELSFNYLLMMVPLWVIDYVIIHELCHLKHLNHSTYFWSLVNKYCVNAEKAKLWLKQHQHMLIWP